MKQLSGVIAPGDGPTFAGRIAFEERITAVDSVTSADGDYILPGFVDLQVNGSHGMDVMTANAAGLAGLARHLASEGTTSFLPTAITAPLDRIERVHATVAAVVEHQPGEHAAEILGMHLEGPFISSARLGAHRALNLAPRGDALERILKLEKLRLITLAPEVDGALDAIRRFCARGVVVSIGHTNATFAEATAGIAVGARMFTHLFNGMRPMHHREPGVIAAALLATDANPAVIPDGIHVDPAILKLVYRTRGAAGMLLTPDTVAIGAGGSQARIEGGAARLGDGTLAGSIISMLDGVRVMVEKVDASVGDAAMMASWNPARMLRLDDRGRIKIGARSDLLVLSRDLKLKAVFVRGRELS
jgi:N-acetylglucosamine-6-phosphate deacetylase